MRSFCLFRAWLGVQRRNHLGRTANRQLIVRRWVLVLFKKDVVCLPRLQTVVRHKNAETKGLVLITKDLVSSCRWMTANRRQRARLRLLVCLKRVPVLPSPRSNWLAERAKIVKAKAFVRTKMRCVSLLLRRIVCVPMAAFKRPSVPLKRELAFCVLMQIASKAASVWSMAGVRIVMALVNQTLIWIVRMLMYVKKKANAP